MLENINLEHLGIVRYWPKIYLLRVLHQNKALDNFHKRRQRPIPGHIKGLDQGLKNALSFYIVKGCVLVSYLTHVKSSDFHLIFLRKFMYLCTEHYPETKEV